MSDLADFSGQYGKSFLTIIWKDDGLRDSLNKGAERVNKRVVATLNYYAPQIEGWMKTNATWTDQTGAARNGLAARAYDEGGARGIVLFHQVPYGIWLEVRWSGRYGIINPALEEWGPRVMAAFNNMLNGNLS